MQKVSVILCAAAISLTALSPALAMGSFHRSKHDHGHSNGEPGNGGEHSLAAPGPIAGVGASAVLVSGGYLWLVRRNRKAKARRQPGA